MIAKQMDAWLEHLSDKPGFIDQQRKQWSDAINLKRKPLNGNNYQYLRKYSPTWPVLQDIMEGAELHANVLAYFINIFDQEASTAALKVQLDETLDSLVTDYDDEELPLKREKKYHELVVKFNGDVKTATQHMNVEKTAFETHKDFTQLLTDAAMNPESSHASVSTQKFAISLSKPWITHAYSDIIAQNRMKIPNEIGIKIDTFNGKTTDGQNENELINNFNNHITEEKAQALSTWVMNGFDQFCLYGGAAIGVLGLVLLFFSPFFGVVALIAGIALVARHFSRKKKIETNRQNIENQYEENRKNGVIIIRALLAEVVDFRAEFAAKDKESEKVLDFLEQLSPDQYIRKLADSPRRINV